jgi:hypothetical protein
LATTPNTYGRFIGRVGALAVALGIGAAIANTPGLALAEEGAVGAAGTSGAAGTTGAAGTSGVAGTSTASESTTPPKDSSTDRDDTATHTGDDEPSETDAPGDAGDDTDHVAGSDKPSKSDDDSDEPSASKTINDSSLHGGNDDTTPQEPSSRPATTSSHDDDDDDDRAADIATVSDSQSPLADSARTTVVTQSTATSSATRFATLSEPSTPTQVTTGLGDFVGNVLSAFGFGTQAASGEPIAPPQAPMLWTMLGWVRREVGNLASQFLGHSTTAAAALVTEDAVTTERSPLATDEQLAAERLAAQTANTLPVALMKIILRQQFLSAAQKQYPNGLSEDSLAALDKAVNEYAVGAAFQQQLLDSMNPTVVTQVAPPHIWFGQNTPGGRILYDNPDTIYRFMGVNGASEYEIHGQFLNYDDPNARPADTTFSVLEGLAGTTSSILTAKDLVVDQDGKFVIRVSTEPADGKPNHLQLSSGSTIIAARNTLGDWNTENPMILSIERVGGPPDSLFAQIGGFAFLGKQVAGNPLLTSLVSLVPPLPYMPPVLRGVFTAAILVVRGASQESKYMALASTDPDTGLPRDPNTVSQPSSNAEFLANQLQSNGHYELQDGQALVLTIDPGRASYFVVPTYDIWTITDDYWNKQTSLNNEQAVANSDGTYTVVISPTDPGVTNWIDTGGLHQGTISIRFQDLGPDPDNVNAPRIVDQRVIDADDAAHSYADDPKYFTDAQQRQDQLDARKAGFDKRWAPYPQP